YRDHLPAAKCFLGVHLLRWLSPKVVADLLCHERREQFYEPSTHKLRYYHAVVPTVLLLQTEFPIHLALPPEQASLSFETLVVRRLELIRRSHALLITLLSGPLSLATECTV